MSYYVFVDYCGTRAQAKADIADHPLLRLSMKRGPNGDLMVGAMASRSSDIQAIKAALLALGPEWDEDAIEVKNNYYYVPVGDRRFLVDAEPSPEVTA